MPGYSLLAGVLLILSCLLPGCFGGVTESGNPSVQAEVIIPGLQPGPYTTLASGQILDAVCAKIVECNPSSTDLATCRAEVIGLSVVDTELGLSLGFGTYGDIIQAERTGAIQADSARLSTCLTELKALGCTSSGVVASYSSGAPSDFSSVDAILPSTPGSCSGVF